MANRNLFNSVQLTKPKKNVFDLTHDVKLTCNMGELVPVCCLETVPGDKFNLAAEMMVRFMPLIAPVMHRMDVTVHYFFVPNRILWSGWEEFITGAKLANPGYVERVPPNIALNDSTALRLANYLGVPQFDASNKSMLVSALPFAAYQKIYNEYYRDQNLISEVPCDLVDGSNWPVDLRTLRRRSYEHDYFTSALPWAQKGEEVSMPITDFNDVKVAIQSTGSGQADWAVTGAAETSAHAKENISNDASLADGDLYALTSNLTPGAASINNLRRAFRLQEWLEKNARAGTRYVENILAHFGVKSSDARLQRPEYIVGVKNPIIVSEIVNTTGEVSGLPQGNMSGHAISVGGGKYGSYFCEEHGYIMGIMSVMPKPAYMQGLPKHFMKTDRLDYFWPSFAHIGEQEVKQVEIYADSATREGTFGYVPRYAEYKYQPNRVAGDFNSSLDYWHLARKFANDPALNQQFIECVVDNDRIFAAGTDTDAILVNVLNKVQAIRPMPKFGSPSF